MESQPVYAYSLHWSGVQVQPLDARDLAAAIERLSSALCVPHWRLVVEMDVLDGSLPVGACAARAGQFPARLGQGREYGLEEARTPELQAQAGSAAEAAWGAQACAVSSGPPPCDDARPAGEPGIPAPGTAAPEPPAWAACKKCGGPLAPTLRADIGACRQCHTTAHVTVPP